MFALVVTLLAAQTPELAPLSPQEPAPEAATAASTAPPPATADALPPVAAELNVAVDLLADGRLPLPSTRLIIGPQFAFSDTVEAAVGVATGYSYAAGEGAVTARAVDDDAFLMAHRVPLRAAARLSLHGRDGPPVSLGLTLSAGADIVFATSHSFGQTSSTTTLAPGASAGARVVWQLSPLFGVGVVGEVDSAIIDDNAVTPGVSTDVGAVRVGLVTFFSFG